MIDGARGSIADVRVDEALVRALLAEQFPQWAALPLRAVDAGGNDHRMYRLGVALSVRLPSAPGYVPQVEKEQAWLPRLAAAVPLAIPAVRGRGRPSHRFPAPWSVYGWLEGEPASSARIDELLMLDGSLAAVIDFGCAGVWATRQATRSSCGRACTAAPAASSATRCASTMRPGRAGGAGPSGRGLTARSAMARRGWPRAVSGVPASARRGSTPTGWA